MKVMISADINFIWDVGQYLIKALRVSVYSFLCNIHYTWADQSVVYVFI